MGDLSIISIRPVVSGQSKAVLGIAGISGSGKTYTAILMARGMVNHPSEIGFLDTENGRGSLYADILDGPFMIADLYPPFSPARYAGAIKQFQEAGVKVLVIDSVTHEWEGEGGCDDIANAPKPDGTPRKIANWIEAKREHKKFMNTLLQSNMDIICCIRAREKTDFKNPNQPVSLGIQPICEKNFMFEMTASLMMFNEGKSQYFSKIPSFLRDAFGDGKEYIGVNTGKKIREWLDKGEQEDPEISRIKSEALMACEQGLPALELVWNKIPKELQPKLKPHFAICRKSAEAYDEARKDSENDLPDPKAAEKDKLRARIEKHINSADSLEHLEKCKEGITPEDHDLLLLYDEKKRELAAATK